MLHWLRAFTFFALGFVAQLFFIVTGLVICLLPKTSSEHEAKAFTQGIGIWYPVHLPKVAWLWDNVEDGARGDHRGWYWLEYFTPITVSLPVKIQVWFAGKGIVSPSFTFDLPKYLPDAFKYY